MGKSVHRQIREIISGSNALNKEELLRWLEKTVASERQTRKDAHVCSQLASEDALTGLLNRRGLEVFFKREAYSQLRSHEKETVVFSLAMLDMDGLKRLNDTLGHGAGDKALIAFSRILNSSFPRKDDIIARYGGDEFVIIFPKTTIGKAQSLLEKFQSAVQKSPEMQYKGRNYQPIQLTASIGVTELHIEGAPDEEILKKILFDALSAADKLMYEAKRGGKNRIQASPSI